MWYSTYGGLRKSTLCRKNCQRWYDATWRHYLFRTVFNLSPLTLCRIYPSIKSALVQIMACRLFGAKPLPEPMITHWRGRRRRRRRGGIWKVKFDANANLASDWQLEQYQRKQSYKVEIHISVSKTIKVKCWWRRSDANIFNLYRTVSVAHLLKLGTLQI